LCFFFFFFFFTDSRSGDRKGAVVFQNLNPSRVLRFAIAPTFFQEQSRSIAVLLRLGKARPVLSKIRNPAVFGPIPGDPADLPHSIHTPPLGTICDPRLAPPRSMARDHDFSDSAVEEAKRLVDEIREKHTSVVHDELEVIVNDLLHM